MVEVKGSARTFSIGEVAARAGVATSALRFYESRGLLRSARTPSGHRSFSAEAIRRVSFIRAAQELGFPLAEIADALASLPDQRTPTAADWAAIAEGWKPRLDERIARLRRLRNQLDACIGCGCLSLDACGIWNQGDRAATLGAGARYLYSDERP